MKNGELIGIWLRTKNVFDNGDDRRTVIGEFQLPNKSRITTRGYANECELIDGVTYRLFGYMKHHPKYGDQFAFSSFVEEKPVDEQSVIAYLEKMCRDPKRGSVTNRVAIALFELYGVNAIDRLIEDPISASRSIKQWDAAKASLAAEYLKSQLGTQHCKLELISLLNGRKFPTRTMDRAIKEWGTRAADLIRKDPYILMMLPGIGFLGADKLYCDLSRDTSKTSEEHIENLAKIHRQGMCAAYAVQTQSRQSGSTWVPVGVARSAVTQTIGGVRARPDEAIEWAVLDGRLVVRENFIASARMALHELEIAEFICNSKDGAEWPSVMELEQCSEENMPLSLHQIDGLEAALSKRVGCLQGSPGCLHGDTVIYDPIDGSNHTVRDRMKKGKEFSVIALDSKNSLVIAKADCPKIYSKSKMIRFTCESGKTITVTHGHLFWDGNSFVSADSLVEALASGEVRLPSISEHDLSVHVQGGLHSKRTTEGLMEYCSAYCRHDDEQLHLSKEACQSSPPSQVDVRELSFGGHHCSDDLVHKQECIHQHQSFSRQSMPNCDHQTALRFDDDDECHSRPECSEPFSGSFSPVSQLDEFQVLMNTAIEPPVSFVQRHQDQPLLYASSSCEKPNLIQGYTGLNGTSLECIAHERIVNIEEVEPDQYFDFHVPIHENYWAEGFFHHNTGKTFSLAVIVKALIKKFGASQIGVAAPTGKAAVRMTQSMANSGVTMNAMTIHRLLQVTGTGGGEGWKFAFNEQNPLPMRFLILDEMSMADVDLMASLVRACTKWTHILFIGDINQLAPVGHGKPFYDLQQCIPTGHLTEIRRNSGRIVQACAEIRDHGRVTFSPLMDLPIENLPLVEVADEDQVQMLQNILTQLDQQGEDIVENCQVITGKNDGSVVARKPLNEMLQKMLNADGEAVKGNPFRIGDKIVCLKNGIYPDAFDHHENYVVANGELGYVTGITYGIMNIRLLEPIRDIKVMHSPVSENEKGIVDSEDAQKGAVGDWDLGYCLSVHRSQGSQWKWVVYMIDSKAGMVQTRNAVYTGFSRASEATFVVGQKKHIDAALRRDGITGRKTFLIERIQRQRLIETADHDALAQEV